MGAGEQDETRGHDGLEDARTGIKLASRHVIERKRDAEELVVSEARAIEARSFGLGGV